MVINSCFALLHDSILAEIRNDEFFAFVRSSKVVKRMALHSILFDRWLFRLMQNATIATE